LLQGIRKPIFAPGSRVLCRDRDRQRVGVVDWTFGDVRISRR
jgi:hypothetical protein